MELREVEKYRAIPKGGWKLVGGIAMFVAYIAALAIVVPFTEMQGHGGEKFLFLVLLGFSALLAMFAYGHALIVERKRLINMWPFLWLRDYWRRNVTGYNVWFWCDEKQKIRVSFTRRGKKGDEDSNPLPCPVIKVPLGGWFNSSGGVYRRHFNEVGLAQGWKVRFPSDPWRSCRSPHVTLIDAEGNSIMPGIGTALDFCEYYFTGDRTTEWILQVDVMLEEIKRFSRERDEAQRNLKEALAREGEEIGRVNEWAWKYAELLMRVIDRLDATKRFIKSKEALRIRQWLVGELDQRLPSGDSRREKYGLSTAMGCATGQRCCEATPTEVQEGG